MRHQYRRGWASRRHVTICAGMMFVAALGCTHRKGDEADYVRPDPIPVHIKNENFLDMNVYAVIDGVARRLGMVTGNGAGDFKINWSVAYGQPIVMRAVPIGGTGSITSPALSVGEGQEIEFKIGSTFRQSTAIVREP